MILDKDILEFPGTDAGSRAVNKAADEIDSMIFSGDPDAQMRQTLRNYMARWERGLKEHDDCFGATDELKELE